MDPREKAQNKVQAFGTVGCICLGTALAAGFGANVPQSLTVGLAAAMVFNLCLAVTLQERAFEDPHLKALGIWMLCFR